MQKSKFYSLAATLTFAVSNVLFYSLLIRHFSTELMREWVLFLVLISFVEMGRQGMVNNGMMRLLAAEPSAKKEIAGSGLFLSILTSFSGLLVAFGLSFFLNPLWDCRQLHTLCLAYFPLALLWGIYKWAESCISANEHFETVFFAVISYALVLIGSFFIFSYQNQLELSSVIGLQCLASAAALCIFFIQKNGRVAIAFPKKKHLLTLLDFGRFNLGTNVLSMLFNKMDMLLIGMLLPDASVVLYDAATRVFNWLDLPMNGLAAVLYPQLCKASKDKKVMANLYEKGVAQLLLIAIPSVAFVLIAAPFILTTLAGSAYVEAADILRVLVLATLIKPWGRLAGMSLDASGRPKLNFYLLVFSVVCNLVLNLTFIHFWGILGAAVATSISILGTVLIGQHWVSNSMIISNLNIKNKFIDFPNHCIHFLRSKLLRNSKCESTALE